MGSPLYTIRSACLCTLCLVCFVSGCQRFFSRGTTSAVPYTTRPPADGAFDEQAKHLNSKGLRAFEAGNLPKAEKYFREALEADVNFGPAHNNLGQIYLARHQLYLAAWEFEYAANLMPELVEPVINQGLAYETGERIDRAAEIYQLAYSKFPQHPHAIASLVRARIKQDGDPDEIGFLLDELIMHDGRRQWVEWAKELRATRYRTSCADCPPQEIALNPSFASTFHGDVEQSVIESQKEAELRRTESDEEDAERKPIVLPGKSTWTPTEIRAIETPDVQSPGSLRFDTQLENDDSASSRNFSGDEPSLGSLLEVNQ